MNCLKKKITFIFKSRYGSSWMYTSSYENIIHNNKPGRLAIFPTTNVIYDITLRMQSALMNADIILCDNVG
jgi:hypothetical protein